ncbi:MAG: Flp family type IVb pilin [Firmicutes bacterium]|nr:Flp family type IVb pilin [Bacillota bacterium]
MNVLTWLQNWLRRLNSKDGQALVEYALILALIAVVVIVALHFLGGGVSDTLNNVASNLVNP